MPEDIKEALGTCNAEWEERLANIGTGLNIAGLPDSYHHYIILLLQSCFDREELKVSKCQVLQQHVWQADP